MHDFQTRCTTLYIHDKSSLSVSVINALLCLAISSAHFLPSWLMISIRGVGRLPCSFVHQHLSTKHISTSSCFVTVRVSVVTKVNSLLCSYRSTNWPIIVTVYNMPGVTINTTIGPKWFNIKVYDVNRSTSTRSSRLRSVLRLYNKLKTALNHRFVLHFWVVKSDRSTTSLIYWGVLQIHSKVLVHTLISKRAHVAISFQTPLRGIDELQQWSLWLVHLAGILRGQRIEHVSVWQRISTMCHLYGTAQQPQTCLQQPLLPILHHVLLDQYEDMLPNVAFPW